ncbi:MAG: PQQ-like beta-propeller repeat protein, partial [Planctomycetia bacterium]|nr:PQQ-like beta-propeller repeat protein [Planctomycetia bacterium]
TGNGQQVWGQAVSDGYENGYGNGPRATPTVDGGLVFAQAAAGSVVCLDADTGAMQWQKDLLAEIGQENITWGLSGSPLVLSDRVWLNPGVVLDKEAGERVLVAVEDRPGYATPVAFRLGETPVVACFTAAGLVGLHAQSGKELFRHEWTTDYDCNIATPIIEGNLAFISSGYDAGCALLELFAKRGEVTAREVYRNKEMRNHFASCILHEGHLYGFDDGMFTCLGLHTGKQKWRERGWNKGALTMADGMLIVLGEQGRLSLVKPNPDKLEVVSDVDALDGTCWTMPVVSAGRLYLRNQSVMKCLDLRRP